MNAKEWMKVRDLKLFFLRSFVEDMFQGVEICLRDEEKLSFVRATLF